MNFRITKIEGPRIPQDEYRPDVMLGVVLLALAMVASIGVAVLIGMRLA